jgi:hypothetical protein
MWKSTNDLKLSEKKVKYISISQKVHFLLFNFVCVDIAFIGTRTLVHAQVTLSNRLLLLWTGLIYTLLVIDVINIAKLQINLNFETFKTLRKDKIITETKDIKDNTGKSKIEIMNESGLRLRI